MCSRKKKRRSWGFQNTPNWQSLDDFEPSHGTSKKATFWENWRFTCILKLIEYHFSFGKLLFSSNCHNLVKKHPNFATLGCFGIVRIPSWWWTQRFCRLMHHRPSYCWKARVQFLMNPTVCQIVSKYKSDLFCNLHIIFALAMAIINETTMSTHFGSGHQRGSSSTALQMGQMSSSSTSPTNLVLS